MTESLSPRHPVHQPAPPVPAALPPGRSVPEFRPIRRGGGGRHRLRQAVRHRPGAVVTGLVAAATAALAGGPLPLAALTVRQPLNAATSADCRSIHP
ncbi:hypothetical protein [Kitasatospora azatica]|uniref:hypothetical protein n=1 Tax=Kitasatospora azatica TaxID=58347 RepID=UPI0005611760|nr:hypothetical protein [Kitasatospora azatica]